MLTIAQTYTFTSSGGTSGTSSLPASVIVVIVIVALCAAALTISGQWMMFRKAGRPGWAAIIPVYNNWVQAEIADKPGWWALLSILPILSFVYLILSIFILIEVSKKFGKSPWFAVLLIFLPIIGYPILGYGKAQYLGKGNDVHPVDGSAPPIPNDNPVVAPNNPNVTPPTVSPTPVNATPPDQNIQGPTPPTPTNLIQ